MEFGLMDSMCDCDCKIWIQNRAGLRRCLVSVEVAPEIKPYFDFAMEQSLLNDSHEKAKTGFKVSFIFIFVMG